MLIEISTLPPPIQQQILAVKNGQSVHFANNGEIFGELKQKPKDSLMATAGLLSGSGIDGLDYERQCRDEWVREWE